MKYFFLIIILSYSTLFNMNIDETVGKFETIKKIELKENDDVVVASVNNIHLSDDLKYLYILSNETNQFIVYDYISGEIINFISPYKELCDSLFDSGKKPHNHFGNNYYYVDVRKDIAAKDFLNNLHVKNNFDHSQLLSDGTLMVSATIYALAKQENSTNTLTDNRTCIIRTDKNLNPIKTYFFDSDYFGYPINDKFLYFEQNNIFGLTFTSNTRQQKNQFDSLPFYSFFKSDGKRLDTIFYLSEEFSKSQKGYFTQWFPLVDTYKDKIYYAHKQLERVYNYSDGSFFDLKNVEASNWNRIHELMNNPELNINYYKLFEELPFLFNNFYIDNGKIIAIFYNHFQTNPPNISDKYFIQFYDLDGKLLNSYSFPVWTDDGELYNIFYSKKHKYFVFSNLKDDMYNLVIKKYNE